MGSAGYRIMQGRERALGLILNEGYKYLVALVGVRDKSDGTQEKARGAYQLFKTLDEKAIRKYAAETAEENGV